MKKLASVTTHRDKDGGGTEDQLTSFEYDGLGRPTKVEFPDHSTETSTYAFGQLKTWKTRKNQTKTIVYDARGREISNTWNESDSSPSIPAPGISRSWDDANRVASLCNIYSTIKYSYDGAGLVLTEENTVAGSGGPALTQYEHYPNGAVSRIVYPNTLSVRRDYNSRGQLSATGSSDSNNNWLLTFATYNYRQDGKLNYQDYANGVHTAFGYDARGVLNQETVSHGGQIYSQRTLYRDDRDRITAFRKNSNTAANPMENGRGDRFRYDEEGQLVEAWYNAADPVNSGTGNTRYDGFNYDQLGNRAGANFLANKGVWLNFARKDTGVNEYRSWNSQVINYDDDISHTAGNGVLMAEGTFAASYNALNQPQWFWSGNVNGGFMSFGYDPLGRCVKRWTGGASDPATNPATYFYYDGTSLIQEGPSASTISQVYMLGNQVDDIVADFAVANNQWMYHHADSRGHAMFLTDGNGTLAEQYEYDAFGYPHCYRVTNGWTTDLPYSSFSNRFLFTGREWLSDLKLYDYRARLYNPELGRFMQPDPKEFAAGDYNLYRYCHNDPVNHSDPTGLSRLTMDGGGDWIKGSDGLSAWDRTVGGMPSNRWQAGPDGAGGGAPTDTGGGRSGDSTGARAHPFIKTTEPYKGGYAAIREARNFIEYSHPEMNPNKYKYRDWRIASLSKYDGNALIPGNIVIDTKALTSYREVVSIMYHELIHKAEGLVQAWRNTPAEHHQHVLKADQVGREYFYYPDPPK